MAQLKPVEVFDYVVFGATGDLTMRKLLPALYQRFKEGQIPDEARIIGTARSKLSTEEYRERGRKALENFVKAEELDAKLAEKFLGLVHYASLNGAEADSTWSNLTDLLDTAPEDRIRVFYLATAPNLYGAICENLSNRKLATDASRVVLEKPIGEDIASANEINDGVGRFFPENHIFRIDHYIGKENVQAILALRFANPIFERVWNADTIDYVQITAAETVGVEGRAPYYDTSGAMRDMIQNHLLQVLTLVAMEPPSSLDADLLRNEKLKVLAALKPIAVEDVAKVSVRGQYVAGELGGKPVPGYLEELGSESSTETFVALKAEIQNLRWAGVPFYLRTGKRLNRKASEVVIQFKAAPWSIFSTEPRANRLVIRIQPDEGVSIAISTKDPAQADSLTLRNTSIDASFAKQFDTRYPDSYERLLLDAVRGDPVLFIRRDEVDASWKYVTPLMEAWSKNEAPLETYTAGSWGPKAATDLLAADGHSWHEDMA